MYYSLFKFFFVKISLGKTNYMSEKFEIEAPEGDDVHLTKSSGPSTLGTPVNLVIFAFYLFAVR